jgi:hypothetical protein
MIVGRFAVQRRHVWLALAVLAGGLGGAHAQEALTGRVSSNEEDAMEGVLVSAKKDGATITTTVVTDGQGRYSFPAARIEPGKYTISIRAVGFKLDGPKTVDVPAGTIGTADLRLSKVKNLVPQLSNGEWLLSLPGADKQKAFLTLCVGCHTLQRVLTSNHDAAEFEQVFLRMARYSPGSTPTHPQALLPGPRGERPAVTGEAAKAAAEFLASVSLGNSEIRRKPRWSRRCIPMSTARCGPTIRRTIPATGSIWRAENSKIWARPRRRMASRSGPMACRAISRTTFISSNSAAATSAGAMPRRAKSRSGRPRARSGVRVAAASTGKTGCGLPNTAATPSAYPKTGAMKEWQMSTPWSAPYDVVAIKNGAEAWTGSMLTDQVSRIDTATGQVVDYLLPRTTNIRRVFVDSSAERPVLWIGSNHGASIAKVEPLD